MPSALSRAILLHRYTQNIACDIGVKTAVYLPGIGSQPRRAPDRGEQRKESSEKEEEAPDLHGEITR